MIEASACSQTRCQCCNCTHIVPKAKCRFILPPQAAEKYRSDALYKHSVDIDARSVRTINTLPVMTFEETRGGMCYDNMKKIN